MIKPAKHVVKWFLKTTKFGGVTIPPFGIYILEERINEPDLRRHESVHWGQYKRMGLVMFYIKYFYYSIRYGYTNNPMEIEARDANNHLFG